MTHFELAWLIDRSPATRAVAERTFTLCAILFAVGPLVIVALRLLRGARTRNVPLGLRLATLVGVTGSVLVPGWIGELPFAVMVGSVVAIGLEELWDALEAAGTPADRAIGTGTGIVLVACAEAFGASSLGAVIALMVGLVFAAALLPSRRGALSSRVGATLLGVVMVGLQGAFLPLLRREPGGFGHVVFVYALMQFNDVFSLVGGLALGKRKLAPELSPAKTWAGAISGLTATLGAALIFRFAEPGLSLPALLGVAALLAMTGLFGGFAASGLKRAAGIKDFGHLLPGHGGVLDRFDSTLFSAPLAWLLLRLVTA